MSNSYYDMTGVLFVEKATTIITALFEVFEIDPHHRNDGKEVVYIADLAEETSLSWSVVGESLDAEVADLLEIQGVCPEVFESLDTEASLRILAQHFQVQDDPELAEFFNTKDFAGEVELDDLIFLAKKFDDGHGLTGFEFEGGWHSDRSRLFEFGGHTEYRSEHFRIRGGSASTRSFAHDVNNGIVANDVDKVTSLIGGKVNELLAGIADEALRRTVSARIGAALNPAPAAFVDAIASMSIWDYDKSDGTPYAECTEPSEGYIDSHCCLMENIEQARKISADK